MTTHTFTLTIEIQADYSTPEPEANWPGGWTLEHVSVPGFTDEQNDTLWRGLRADMEQALMLQAIEQIKQRLMV